MKQKRVLCVGDSNTYGYDPRSYFGSRYGAESRWTDLLAGLSGWTVLNAGENGRSIPVSEVGKERILGLVERSAPLDYLLIMLGTNDLLQGASAVDAAGLMERFIKRIPLKREQIVLIAPPLMKAGEWVTEDSLIGEAAELASEYALLSKRLKVQYVDATEWKTDLSFDGVHFSEVGHRQFAGELWLRLRRIEEIEQNDVREN